MMKKRKNVLSRGKIFMGAVACCIWMAVAVTAGAAPRVVMIDPGHGGAEKGIKVASGEYEKDVVLAVASEIQAELKKRGAVRAVLTRTKDESVSLAARRKAAKSAGAGLLVSLHLNAGFGAKSSGYEIGVAGFDSTGGERENNSKEIVKDMIRNQYFNDSVRFAQMTQRTMERVFPREGRGIRGADFAVLHNAPCPAVLLEMGFVTNAENSESLLRESTQKKLAAGIAASIEEYFRQEKP